MKKFLKYTSITLITIILLAVLSLVTFIYFVNPNVFKPAITSQIKKYTNREVKIEGDLSWTLFPNLGVKIGHTSMSNPIGSEQTMLVEITDITITAKLLPLLQRRFEIEGAEINGATITWVDVKANQYYKIKNAKFRATDVKLMENFPITLQFEFQPKKSAAFIPISLNSHIKINTVEQTLVCNDIDGRIANISVTGNAHVDHMSDKPLTTGHLTIKPFNLRQTLHDLGQDTDSIQTAKNAKGSVDFSFDNNGMKMHSNITLDALQINHVQMMQIGLQARFQKGTLDINPITAALYQGTLQGKVKIDMNGVQPKLAIDANLKNIQAEPLLRDLGNKDKKITVAGSIGNIDLQVTSSGADSKTITRNLNGTGRFNFNNGSLVGIDLNALVNNAFAIIKKQPASFTNSNKTNFDNLTGTMTIHNGVLQNDDLLLVTSLFETKGKGRIDLPSQWINYLLYTTIKKQAVIQQDDWMNLYGVAVPIAIRGRLNDPIISVDAGELLKSIAKKQLSPENVKEQVKKQIIKSVVPGLSGPGGIILQQMINQ